jgi:hypothetical protein
VPQVDACKRNVMIDFVARLQSAEIPMSPPLVAKQSDATMAGVEASVVKTVQRLGRVSRYEPPKVISFPIDGMRVAEPISLAGNSY